MIRYLMVTVALLFTAAAVQAENIRGLVKSVDANRTQITVVLPGNTERTLEVSRNVRVFGNFLQGRARRATVVTMELPNGMTSLQVNTPVLLTTVTRDGNEVVTQVRLEGNSFGGVGRRR